MGQAGARESGRLHLSSCQVARLVPMPGQSLLGERKTEQPLCENDREGEKIDRERGKIESCIRIRVPFEGLVTYSGPT